MESSAVFLGAIIAVNLLIYAGIDYAKEAIITEVSRLNRFIGVATVEAHIAARS